MSPPRIVPPPPPSPKPPPAPPPPTGPPANTVQTPLPPPHTPPPPQTRRSGALAPSGCCAASPPPAPRHLHPRRPLAKAAEVDRQRAVVVQLPQRAQPIPNPSRQHAEFGPLRQLLPAFQFRWRHESHPHTLHPFRHGRQAQHHRRRPLA